MNITELKNIIKTKIPDEYRLKTNFSSPDFLVEIGRFIIIAKPICTEKEVKYEFMLNTEFLSENTIKYNDLIIIKNVIDILETNRKTAISRLKKWTVEEYKEDIKMRERRSEAMFEALKNALRMQMG